MSDVPSLNRSAIDRLAVRMGIEWPVEVEWVEDPDDGRAASVYHAPEAKQHVIALFARPDVIANRSLLTFALVHELVHARDYEAGRYHGRLYDFHRSEIEAKVSREALRMMPETLRDPLFSS